MRFSKGYILLIRAVGDGSLNVGRRHTSVRFRTLQAAQQAEVWTKRVDPEAITEIVED